MRGLYAYRGYLLAYKLLMFTFLLFVQIVVMPTVPEYRVYQEASAEVQENMTYYYNQSASLRTWSANSEKGSQALSPVFGDIFGEGQSN